MEDHYRHLGLATNLSSPNTLGNWNNCIPAEVYGASPSTLNLYGLAPKGTKRKWPEFSSDRLQPWNSPPSSSSDTGLLSPATFRCISPAKETDDESSIENGINFKFGMNTEVGDSRHKSAANAQKIFGPEPSLELQLSLSTISESVVTNVDRTFTQHKQSYGSKEGVVSFIAVDEGTKSSHWKSGNCTFLFAAEQTTTTPPKQVTSEICDQSQLSLSSPTVMSCARLQQQNNSGTKSCQHPGCLKGARGSSGLCIAHGGGKRCRKEGCTRGAEGKTVFCKSHGGGRRCLYLGCVKSAEGRTDYCIGHGGGRRCSHEGCTRAARGKSGRCIKHGGGKRCQKEKCTKSAEGQSGLCIAHGGGRRCQYPQCPKGAQGSTYYCKAHGGGKRCTYAGCSKGAEGSTPFCKSHGGGKRCAHEGCSKCVHGGTQFCVAHGGGKRCAAPECTKSARGKTDYCVRHGGGKRCQTEGCTKSAQGSTDFCKAHGGGKRCSWGQLGSGFGAGGPPCDHFARGKEGLCRQHNAMVEDQRIHGGEAIAALSTGTAAMAIASSIAAAQEATTSGGVSMLSWGNFGEPTGAYPTYPAPSVSIPEGRVHGKNFMALFPATSSANYKPPAANQGETSASASFRMWLG